ncbi:hypothetical protein RRG08_057125 [Elysia crispata]|uniref:Uncharacterized protein n=1 Tax=Elysia crispata TaxID=231223 RepID=A0AAE1DL02_9GAST|nr:hypothetical protein RRG08_057125 [Elysia crispata]
MFVSLTHSTQGCQTRINQGHVCVPHGFGEHGCVPHTAPAATAVFHMRLQGHGCVTQGPRGTAIPHAVPGHGCVSHTAPGARLCSTHSSRGKAVFHARLQGPQLSYSRPYYRFKLN